MANPVSFRSIAAAGALALAGFAALAQDAPPTSNLRFDSAEAAEHALGEAQSQGEAARKRADALEAEAARASGVANRTAQETAAIAARIQQTESALAANEARLSLIAANRAALRASLAARQQPLVRLTGALQRLSRRPMLLSLLRPGTLEDTVHLNAVFKTVLPEVNRRTAALKHEIAAINALQQREGAVRRALAADSAGLAQRRTALAALETQQRLAGREAREAADREGERALALAEQARDIGTLTRGLAQMGSLREQLAALPGPVLRPPRPDLAEVTAPAPIASAAGLTAILLPVDGRLISGFGQVRAGAPTTRGIAIAPRARAQAVAPAAGRVAFAGPFRGYGTIVIIEHSGGWTSLITGLSSVAVAVGDSLVAGAPIGNAASSDPLISFELRRNNEPVNPLELVRSCNLIWC